MIAFELYHFITLLTTCLVFHELGHLLIIKLYKKPFTFSFKAASLNIHSTDLTQSQYKITLFSGVIFGLLPLVASSYIINTTFSAYFHIGTLIIVLFMGSGYDIYEIFKEVKK